MTSVHKRRRTTRGARKLHTRRALLDAALRLLEQRSFDGLSLREVTKEAGIVPAAFYRHFRNMEELGLALVDESITSLREMIRSARSSPLPVQHTIRRSVGILVRHVHAHQSHHRFIVRELHSGSGAVRQAIRRELLSFEHELALDLSRLPHLDRWSAEDLQMVANLMVNAMVSIAASILDTPPGSPEAEERAMRQAEKQLRLIILGVPHWRPPKDASSV